RSRAHSPILQGRRTRDGGRGAPDAFVPASLRVALRPPVLLIVSTPPTAILIPDAAAWATYVTAVAQQAGRNQGDEAPARYPALVCTTIQYHGSVSIGPDDYTVLHQFVYPEDARRLLGADPATPVALDTEGREVRARLYRTGDLLEIVTPDGV